MRADGAGHVSIRVQAGPSLNFSDERRRRTNWACLAWRSTAAVRHPDTYVSGSKILAPVFVLILLALALPPRASARASASQSIIHTVSGALAHADPEDQRDGLPAGQPLSGAALDQKTTQVASQVRCPVCQGSSIGDSPSSTAQDMKREVRQMLAAGYTERQVISYFVYSYGDFIREKPPEHGFPAVVWIAPPLLLLLGALVVVFWLRNKSRAPAAEETAPAPAVAADDPELASWLAKVRALDGEKPPKGS